MARCGLRIVILTISARERCTFTTKNIVGVVLLVLPLCLVLSARGLLHDKGHIAAADDDVVSIAADDVKPQVPHPDPECGPRSLWVAAGRVGVSLDLATLPMVCHMRKAGTSMLDLRNGAVASGVRAEGVKMTWHDLVKLDAPAILFVSGNHFLCVDPREKTQHDGEDRLRVYDLPGATLWMGRDELAAMWKGEALVIRRGAQPVPTAGPRACFDATFADFGTTAADTALTHEFVLENIGAQPLRILALKKSCGCASLEGPEEPILPGHTGKIVMRFDPTGRQGSQLIQGVVRTNDPTKILTVLTYRGVMARPVLVTPGSLDFGLMARDQQSLGVITVTDRGDQTLQLAGRAVVVLDKYFGGDPLSHPSLPKATPHFDVANSPQAPRRTPVAEAEQLPPSPRTGTEGYPRKHTVRVQCRVGQDVPYGAYFGTLRVPGKRQSGETLVVQVPVALTVERDLFAEPHLRFGVLTVGETRSRIVHLKRRSGKPIEIISCRTVDEAVDAQAAVRRVQPKCRIVAKGGDFAAVEVSLTVPPMTAGDADLLSGTVEFIVAQDEPLRITWIAACRPDK